MSMAGRVRSVHENESNLIARAQRGDLDSFNVLVTFYQNAVFSLAYRIMGDSQSAADAAQEAFISAYRRLATFRGENFRGWLLRITANQCYDELRRLKRKPAISVNDLPDAENEDGPALPDPGDSPEQAAQRRELASAVQQCIHSLPADQRMVLVLSDVEGMDYAEIAETAQVALGTVKSRLSRARAAVRNCLQAVRELLPAEYRLVSDET